MPNPIPTVSREIVTRREMGRCFRCGCPAQPGEWHHRRRRNVKDEHQHCPCNGISLCKTCHDWVHAHPFEARRYGWIVSAHEPDPGAVPVKAHFGWLLLNGEGGFTYADEPEEFEAANSASK